MAQARVINFAPQTTARRRHKLERYFNSRVLTGDRFCCAHALACKKSAIRPGVDFYEGQLSYLGRHYDVFHEGNGLRVLIVSMEVGMGPAHVTMAERDPQVRDRISQRFVERNPHMRGVTLALRLAFGLPLNDDAADEHLRAEAGSVHVFDAFAMANLLLCSAAAPGRKSRATDTMRANCIEHLAATIAILEPTLVISQGLRKTGKSVESELRRLFKLQTEYSEHVCTAVLDETPFTWVALRHPTHNWDWISRPYFHEVVVPAITRGRSLALSGP